MISWYCPACAIFNAPALGDCPRCGVARSSWPAKASRPAPTPPLPWYEESGRVTAIRAYASVEAADMDANWAARHGWSVQSIATSDGHVNLGRTAAGAALTGGLSLLLGGSRTKGSVTVTFVRAP